MAQLTSSRGSIAGPIGTRPASTLLHVSPTALCVHCSKVPKFYAMSVSACAHRLNRGCFCRPGKLPLHWAAMKENAPAGILSALVAAAPAAVRAGAETVTGQQKRPLSKTARRNRNAG